MYDYCESRFPLTEAEQEKALALRNLGGHHLSPVFGRETPSPMVKAKRIAYESFKAQFYNEVFERLGYDSRSQPPANISKDNKEIVIFSIVNM